MTPPPFPVFKYIEWYPTGFDGRRFHWRQTYGNEVQMCNRLDERCDMAVAEWAKSGNHCSSCGAHRHRWLGKDKYSLSVPYREKVDYECRLV